MAYNKLIAWEEDEDTDLKVCENQTEVVTEQDFPVCTVPVETIKYQVKKSCASATPISKQKNGLYWQEEYPRLLDGLVDKKEYFEVITKINEITHKINKKKRYSDPTIVSLAVTGVLLYLPLFPFFIILDKKQKKDSVKHN